MSCISCGKSSLAIYSENSFLKLPVYQCKNCNLYITGNSEDELKTTLRNYYEKSIISDEITKTIDMDHNTNHGRYLKNLWKSHYVYCNSFFHNSKNLLEIGPGSGLTLRMFKDLGFSVMGVEQNKIFTQFINNKLGEHCCMQGYFEDVHFDKKFDIIWLSHCLEHTVRPDILLEKCKTFLNDEGFIFIAVPDCENKNILQASVFENASSFHFTKRALSTLANKTRFRIEKCESFRELMRFEGRIEMLLEKYFPFIGKMTCPYYPFKFTEKNGTEIRIILKNL